MTYFWAVLWVPLCQSDTYYVITCTAVFLSLLPHAKPCVVCLKCSQSLLGCFGSSQLAGKYGYVSHSLDPDIFPESNI